MAPHQRTPGVLQPGDLQPSVLRPGVVVVPRTPDRLVVGHDRAAVTVPDSPEARALLAELTGTGRPAPTTRDPADAWRLWRRLADAGLLVTVGALRGARTAAGTARGGSPGPGIAAADAAVLEYGDDAPSVLRARVAATVALHGPEELRLRAAPVLQAAGLTLAPTARRAAVHLVAGDVAPDPATITDLVRRAEPHLLLVRDASGVTVGPFVVPGHTACAGCLEAARADRDPDQGMLRLLRRRELRERTIPGDPATLALALAVAARDLTVWAAGDEPSTWSATRSVTLAGEQRVELRRHPRCGCAWDALAGDVG